MNDIGRKKGLKGFEVAKNIYIEPVGFQSKEILTNTMKIQRHEARRVYKKEVQDLYKEGMLPVDKEKK
jgi:long-chain acyl-CoA synthetase